MTAEKQARSCGGRTSSTSCTAEETEGGMAMISPETQTSRLLRETANLLNSVAEAAWTNDIPSPARWDLHRIGTEAYLAQRDILHALGQSAAPTAALPGIDVAAALEQAAHTLAAVTQELHNLDSEGLVERVAALAGRALDLAPRPTRMGG
jgi:hypothetical protein